MEKQGLFCVFEGIDGAGKSTLLQNLADRIDTHLRKETLFLKEPTDSVSGQKIRRLLAEGASLTPEDWLELFITDRRQNVAENILPAYHSGKIILQDRYFYSTAAYQSVGDMNSVTPGKIFSPQYILNRNSKEGFPEPDLLFFIALDPRLAYERIQKRSVQKDSFEEYEYLYMISVQYEKILPQKTIRLDGQLSSLSLCDEAWAHLSRAVAKCKKIGS